MTRQMPEVKLAVLDMNPVAAKISIAADTAGKILRAECFEVGVDGGKPDSPVAVAAPDLTLQIGTPFLWSQAAQPRYAVIISVEQGGVAEYGEIQFGFDAAGNIVVTEPVRKISPPAAKRNPKLPSLFVVGDSTAFSNGWNQRGWGDELGKLFDPAKINVLNRARPGRSTRSYRREGLWLRVLGELKSGDFVLIQFGHNDADNLAEGRCRGVLTGVGEETQIVSMPDGSRETVHTFGWYLRQFIAETQATGATPVLLSPTAKNLWREDGLVRPQSHYGEWSSAVAAAGGVAFLDLTEMIADRYAALGREKVRALFGDEADLVHTSPAGAELNAKEVCAGLRSRFAGRLDAMAIDAK